MVLTKVFFQSFLENPGLGFLEARICQVIMGLEERPTKTTLHVEVTLWSKWHPRKDMEDKNCTQSM
jgi:hypothetical protein